MIIETTNLQGLYKTTLKDIPNNPLETLEHCFAALYFLLKSLQEIDAFNNELKPFVDSLFNEMRKLGNPERNLN